MNDYRAYVENDYNSIYHHGIKGQRWGIRRYQNTDGSLTPLGRQRYGKLYTHMKHLGYSDKQIGEEIKRREAPKTIAKAGLAIAGVAALGYGAYKGVGYLKRGKISKPSHRQYIKLESEKADNVAKLNINPITKASTTQRDIRGKTPDASKMEDGWLKSPFMTQINKTSDITKTDRNRIKATFTTQAKKNSGESKPDGNWFKSAFTNRERKQQINNIDIDAGKSMVDELLKSNAAGMDIWKRKLS